MSLFDTTEPIRFKTVQMANFTLWVFYQDKKKIFFEKKNKGKKVKKKTPDLSSAVQRRLADTMAVPALKEAFLKT